MRFVTSFTNTRGGKGGGGIRAGDGVHTRGWDAGVTVTARERGADGKQDEFDVYMTKGSHATDTDRAVHLGTVAGTANGPVWTPASKPGPVPARAGQVPVIAAIPVDSHKNNETPSEYDCVVVAGHWPSGEPRFGTARVRNDDGRPTVTGHSDYWDAPMSQVAAITEMIRATGHERPGATSLGQPVPGAPTLEESRSISRDALTVIRNLLTEEQLDAPIPALAGKTARQLLAGSE
jgi:hypothetical protein